MNPISAFFVQNIIAVYFLYGLAFFVMGLALALASRQNSEFRFARAIRPLAAFGILHGLHEWFEMFQQIEAVTTGHVPSLGEEGIRLAILVFSFLMLPAFGVSLLVPQRVARWRKYGVPLGLLALWGVSLGLVTLLFAPSPAALITLADVLARYSLGIPGAMLGTWALMIQQRTFREHDMPQFGRDLVWCAAALFLYGVVGQLFVRQTALFPSNVLNSVLFFEWFGIPIQLFRGLMAAVLTFYIVRALKAFELENQRRLGAANQAKLQAQTAALEAERHISHEMERLNEELRLTTRELSLLLDLSNLLATPMSLHDRLELVLQKIVQSLSFPEAGLILLAGRQTKTVQRDVAYGFTSFQAGDRRSDQYLLARSLGEQCVARNRAMCRHVDGAVLQFLLEETLASQKCRHYLSPTVMISLPLTTQQQVIGAVVLSQPQSGERELVVDELKLMVGVGQQLGLLIENARLYQEAQTREKMLAELLHQVVGAQEAERRRIARELHDATGQSLTAISLGLRGVENMLAQESPSLAQKIGELKLFGTNALGELRQIITDLRPSQLDDLGLVAALQWYGREFEKRRAIQVDFVVEGEPVRLSSEYETVLFRITQEALTNIAKHAQATRATVGLKISPSQICLSIEDDGCGFEPQQGQAQEAGWGLLGIAERAALLGGHYELDSAPGQGTRIEVTIPLVMEQIDVEDTTAAG